MSDMINKALETVKRCNMLSRGDTVLIALSGGADSMALYDFFKRIKSEYNLVLKVAHIEHGIRESSSASDCDFVRRVCEKDGIECFVKHINAPELSEEYSVGIEEISRIKRYEFFESIDCNKIATAHNLNDNIETVLFRLIRGTSTHGACGIPYVRNKIIRPLIECTSQEIRNYCKENSIDYRIDETNSDNSYSRNYIRNEIIPKFKELSSAYEAGFLRFIKSNTEAYEYICKESEKLICASECEYGYNSKLLNEAHPAVLKNSLSLMLNKRGLSCNEFHIEQMFSIINARGRVQLSDNAFAYCDGTYFNISLKYEQNEEKPNSFRIEEKVIEYDQFVKNKNKYKKEIDFYSDYDKIVGKVNVRARKSGDCIRINGRNCTKSLKKLFNEMKIPASVRNNIPVVCDECGVIFVCSSVCERVAVSDKTKRVALFKIKENQFA